MKIKKIITLLFPVFIVLVAFGDTLDEKLKVTPHKVIPTTDLENVAINTGEPPPDFTKTEASLPFFDRIYKDPDSDMAFLYVWMEALGGLPMGVYVGDRLRLTYGVKNSSQLTATCVVFDKDHNGEFFCPVNWDKSLKDWREFSSYSVELLPENPIPSIRVRGIIRNPTSHG